MAGARVSRAIAERVKDRVEPLFRGLKFSGRA